MTRRVIAATRLPVLRAFQHDPKLSGYHEWSRSYSAISDYNGLETIHSRVVELRERLAKEDKLSLGGTSHVFSISENGKSFLRDVNSQHLNKRYSRGGKGGEGFVGVEEVVKMLSDKYYSQESMNEVLSYAGSIQDRMRVKVSDSFLQHVFNVPSIAKEPNPILKIVMPDAREIADLAGEIDPSNQNRYSPLPGLLHKYEMLLAYTSINCSSHCRYCYRLDLFDGSSNKSKADMNVVAAYIKTYNDMVDRAIVEYGSWDEKQGLYLHRETKEPLINIREILFSGGDPMTLPNATLARYMTLMAEAGITSLRIGTKELSFNPSRFDQDFWKMMDMFNKNYPETRIEFVGHYTHPYELVDPKVDRRGNYLYDLRERYSVRKDLVYPLHAMKERDWIGHHNQFPIIAGVNDSVPVLRLLMYQSNRLGIAMHNVYACREIRGSSHFRENNTLERQYNLLEDAKNGLSGIENHARLVMSTEYGKVEIVGIESDDILLRLNRYVNSNKQDRTIVKIDHTKLSHDEKVYWLTKDLAQRAVSEEGRQILDEIEKESGSFIKHLRKAAASAVMKGGISNDNSQISTPCGKVVIKIIDRQGGEKVIEVDLSDERYRVSNPTLATVLKEGGEIEAACDEKLSCSTCVGEVQSNAELPKMKEDEMDLIDSASSEIPSPILRASCQIPLVAGAKYLFKK